MSEYLIKRSVEKDGLPKSHQFYLVEDPNGLIKNEKIMARLSANGRWFKDEDIIYPEFWYEPTTLPEITAGIVSKKDIEILHQTTAKNEWKLLREETLAELNKMRELNESLSETILQQNEEIVELNNRLAEKK